MKYFKPVKWQNESAQAKRESNKELQQKLINNFVRNNKEKFNEIKNAVDSNDIKLAHRLVHTLKSNAGQINKINLQHAAMEVESRLKDGTDDVTAQQMKTLKKELNKAMIELTPLVKETVQTEIKEPLETQAALDCLNKLEGLLDDGDTECLSFIDDLKKIPASAELIDKIENFDFKPALDTLAKLKIKVLNNEY